jgi:hypothetical protein
VKTSSASLQDAVPLRMGPRNRRGLAKSRNRVRLDRRRDLGRNAEPLLSSSGTGGVPGTAVHDGGFTRKTDARYDANFQALVYGVTKQQVRDLVGPLGAAA